MLQGFIRSLLGLGGGGLGLTVSMVFGFRDQCHSQSASRGTCTANMSIVSRPLVDTEAAAAAGRQGW